MKDVQAAKAVTGAESNGKGKSKAQTQGKSNDKEKGTAVDQSAIEKGSERRASNMVVDNYIMKAEQVDLMKEQRKRQVLVVSDAEIGHLNEIRRA